MTIILLCIAGFFAAFVDSIAGGGGTISLPAFLLAGIPPHMALGTNKFASTAASLTSSIKYARSDKVNWNLMKFLIPMTALGATIGVQTVLKMNQEFLKTMVLVLILLVGFYSLFSKSLGKENRFQGNGINNILAGMILAVSLGFYDGFFGPGTGSFLIFGLIIIFGFDFLRAGGNARILNFISNIVSLVIFIGYGKVDYQLGVPVAIAMIAGAWLGTRLALKNGVKLVKPIFVMMSLGVAVKLLWDLVGC